MSQGPALTPPPEPSPAPPRPLRIGITCYPSLGGSGVIATEIGLSLARRGHEVHFICYAEPGRLLSAAPRPATVRFHRVEVPDYPLPHLSLYPLTLASALAEVMAAARLDLVHLHYALPHATSALLARQMVAPRGLSPRLLTTLHGTDVTRLGGQRQLLPITRHSLLSCDGLTAPSRFLREAALSQLRLPADAEVEVIPNFVDTARFSPGPRQGGAPPVPVLVHGSNFRPLKRVEDCVRILAAVRAELPAELVLLGDGPERPRVEALVAALRLGGAVRFLGERADMAEALRGADLFLLPSESEGFGLAALEAQACGLPVVAARVGGVPEVVAHGDTGLLCEPGDVDAMAAAVLRLLRDPALRGEMSRASRARVLSHFQQEPTVARYEAYYHRLLQRPARAPGL